ncbi:hypothetical protein SAMN05414139_01515 [Burkholderia sp. D7]|nr:hypothetical protein SAMN05414139_01515 [Burkholderia sp. D7]
MLARLMFGPLLNTWGKPGSEPNIGPGAGNTKRTG